jgi:hypothetical protein
VTVLLSVALIFTGVDGSPWQPFDHIMPTAPAVRVVHGCSIDPLCYLPPEEVDPWPDIEGTPSDEAWERIAQCESNGNWAISTGNGYYGGVQFALSSWRSVGGEGYPNQASKDEQIYRADLLWQRQGWPAWPACSRKLGYR